MCFIFYFWTAPKIPKKSFRLLDINPFGRYERLPCGSLGQNYEKNIPWDLHKP